MAGNCLYERLKQQVSYDNGATWQDTGVYSTGSLIERDSPSCGYITDYVFVIPGRGRDVSTSVTSGSTTLSYPITSTKNGSFIDYTIVAPNWCDVFRISTGIIINVAANPSSSVRRDTIYLLQNESDLMITVMVVQAAESSPYIFTFDDGYMEKSTTVHEDGGAFMYQVISLYNSQSQPYSLTSSPSWATVTLVENNIRVVIGENTGNTRAGRVLLTQSESNKTISIIFSQASSVPYVFTFSSGEELEAISSDESGGTYSLGVISTHGSDSIRFSVTDASPWLETSISNGTLYVTIPTNSGDVRTGYIELKQQYSKYKIYVSVTQAARPPYIFTFDGGQTYTSTTAVAAGGRYCYQVVSTQGENTIPYGVYNAPEWTEIEVTGNSACVTVSSNTSSARTGIVTLQQSGSSKTIQINLSQQSGTTPVITGDYLTAIFLEDGEFFTDRDDVSYSVNGAPWSSIESYSLSQTFPAGTIVKYKCTESFGSLTPRLIFSKKVNVSGYPASMIFGDNFMEHMDSVPDKGFYRMFSPCHQTYNYMTRDYCWYCSFSIRSNNIVDASGIRLPATTVSEYAYYQMFEGNPYLTAAPAISATTLDKYCFQEMFKGCTSLTTAPALPATTLADNCYESMFSGCTSLTTAPTLPATTLANYCYWHMFQGCTSLTTAPELPATTLAGRCYYQMFEGCTSLTTAPVLSASTLVGGCYNHMFYGCSSLTGITCLATGDTSGKFYVRENGYYIYTLGWLYNVAPSGIFTKHPYATVYDINERQLDGWWKDNDSGIPPGWIVADNGEYLFTLSNGEESASGTSLYSGGALTYGIVSEYLGSGVQYTASSSTEWLATSIVGSSLTINIAANPAYHIRNGVVTLKQSLSNKTITINVEQMQNFPPTPPPGYDYLTFIALEDGFTISCSKNCYYKINDGEWSGTSAYTSTDAVNAGDMIRIMGNVNLGGQWMQSIFNTNGKRFNLSGCPASMTHGADYASYMTGVTNDEFRFMFYGLPVVDASGVKLPATTLANRCYQYMFADCTSLTTAPELPATTLASYCYTYMFQGCTGLTTAPSLPATTLANRCYQYMFADCTSLTTAPALPATTLAEYCYNLMFYNCTSLTTAPALPATTLADSCYYFMFEGCTSLTTAPALPATTLAGNCYNSMFSGCTSLTTAPTLPATTLANYCYNEMFNGCTSLTTAPSILTATTLANHCYQAMFMGCTSLTTAPELPATTLVTCCYDHMFYGCTSLNYIKCLATNRDADACTSEWVSNVAATGTFVKAAGMSGWPTGANGIPQGWTIVDNA